MRRAGNAKKIITTVLLAAALLAGCGKENTDASAAASSAVAPETNSESTANAENTVGPAKTEEAAETPKPEDTEVSEPEGVEASEPEDTEVSKSEDATATEIRAEDIPAYTGDPYITLNGNRPRFTEKEITTEVFEEYEPLDELGRTTGAFACLSRELMPTEERGMIGSVRPSGWHTVKYDGIDGAYLYNRCHLIAYQLTGENDNANNLITGTRYMNVEGMQPFENRVAWYVRVIGYHVMYRATPLYEGNNLLASGILLESYCVEKPESSATFCVFCYNVQPDVEIDYATGDSTGPAFTGSTRFVPYAAEEQEGAFEEAGEPSPIPEEVTFIGNLNSEVLHYPWCSSVDAMSEKNKKYFTEPLEEIPTNYHLCGYCMKDVVDPRVENDPNGG